MRSIRTTILAGLFLALPLAASAQNRVWVAGQGDDANPCSRTAPCRTFAGAYGKASVHAEINCIDAGSYGSLTITHSITIDCSSTEAGDLASGTNGFTLNNVPSTDVVVLRGIDMNGTSGGQYGVYVTGTPPAFLIIDNCNIYNFTLRGVSIETIGGTANVVIRDSRIHAIQNHAIACLPTAGGSVNLLVEGVKATDNAGLGIDVYTNSNAVVRDSTFTHHGAAAILVEAPTAVANVYNTTLSQNAQGIQGSAGTARLFGCQITDNTANGILITGGLVMSHQNNAIAGNTGNEVPSSLIGTQ